MDTAGDAYNRHTRINNGIRNVFFILVNDIRDRFVDVDSHNLLWSLFINLLRERWGSANDWNAKWEEALTDKVSWAFGGCVIMTRFVLFCLTVK